MGKTAKKKPEKQLPKYRQLYNKETRDLLLDWWRDLEKSTGPRAKLRRCASPEEAALHSSTYRIMQILPWASHEAIATMAGILSHIRSGENDPLTFGAKMGKPSEPGGSSPLSELRFQQLLKSRDWNELYRNLRRAVQVLDGNINPLMVADLILSWDRDLRDDQHVVSRKSVKFQLSKDYYTNSPPPKKNS